MDEQVIDSLKDPWVDMVRRALGQVGRGRATCFLAEGARLVEQALDAKAPIEAVFYRPEAAQETMDLVGRAASATVACRCMSKGIFFRVLDLGYETAADILAVVRRPDKGAFATISGESPCLLVGECVQDPRNVGVLVRTADAWKLAVAVFGAGRSLLAGSSALDDGFHLPRADCHRGRRARLPALAEGRRTEDRGELGPGFAAVLGCRPDGPMCPRARQRVIRVVWRGGVGLR
jgi:hypothetical protein